jgi:hypothetical protein
VPEASACIDGHDKIALDTDHFKINKFYGPDDPSLKLVYPEIVQMAQNAKAKVDRRRYPKRIPTDQSSTSGDLRRLLQELRVTNPRDVLADIQTQKGERVGNTCEWILRRSEFLTWAAPAVDDKPHLLRLVGSPGIGKTMLSTFLVETLREKVEKSSGKALVYFFCDDKHQDRRTSTAITRSLIWQLLLQRNELFEHVRLDFDAQGTTLFENFSALWRIFQCMLQDERAGQVFILIDALDESDRATREGLLQGIRKLFKSEEQRGSFNFLITCRPDIGDIERQFKTSGTFLRIDSADINNDLSQYIEVKVNGLTGPSGDDYPPSLREDVRDFLKKEAGGTFLWVSIMVAELCGVVMHEVKKTITNLPHGLYETYAAIFNQISPQNRDTARFILLCMVAAQRPLTKGEIQHAFAAWKTGSASGNLDVYADLLATCSSILYVGRAAGENYETLNFCHQSVKDFLLCEVSSADKKWYHTAKDEANLLIFEACWKYLSADELRNGRLVAHYDENQPNTLHVVNSWKLTDLFSQHLFLEYASSQWENHATASYPALLNLHGTTINLGKAPTLRDAWFLRTAREGQVAVVKWLLEKGAEIQVKDRYGGALSWAAWNGHEAVVKLLLNNNADVDSKNIWQETPLLCAAANGHEAVVKLLLNNNADVKSRDRREQTPLLWAVMGGHETVVKILLDNGADTDTKEAVFGWTALFIAVQHGHEAFVKLLIDKGSDFETEDRKGQTPLSLAAKNNYEGIVKLLLDKRAETDKQCLIPRSQVA